jgi:WD40 repeat protein
MFRSRYCFCILCAAMAAALAYFLLLPAPQSAAAQEKAKAPVSFINDVAPILKENCMGCHSGGKGKAKGKFDMTTYKSFREGGTKDDPITDGKPDESYIIEALNATDKTRMPPHQPGEIDDGLPKAKIATIEQWIKEGAKLDEGIKEEANLIKELRARWKPPTPPAAFTKPVTVTSLAFTPDNAKLVVSGNHELTVWDVANGKLEKRIYTRTRRALAMVFLPDGKLAVAGGRPNEEGDVRIYDINGGTPKMQDGVAILDGVNDKAVMIKQLVLADDEVLCLALSADGKKLASGGCDRVVNVWDLSPGYADAKLEQSIENHADWVFGVAFAEDGKHLFTCSRDKTAKVWDLATKESVTTFPDHQNGVYGVAVKADGKVGYSVGEDNQLRAWNAAGDQAGKQVRNVGAHAKAILKLVAHPKQPLLVTCSADNTVKLWNADNFQAVRTLPGHTDWVYALALSPDGNLVAAGSYTGDVKVWKVADGTVVKEFNATPGLAPKK